ncbi:MAG: M28 family peptidase [Defluviitaleaceae bacterium]|nr:M28 family peptidase [Defluviitaleaceae bacterium]
MKRMKAILAWVLVAALVLPLIATPMAVSAEPVPFEPISAEFVPIMAEVQWEPVREFFEGAGGVVTWIRADRSIHIAIDGGSIVLFLDSTDVLTNDVPGNLQTPIKLEDGVSYIAQWDLIALVEVFIATLPVVPVELPAWITDRQPLTHTTDHGQMALDFIVELNDNFYDRVAFTYRELEAAQWIADQLVNMGFDEDAVYMQNIYLGDVHDMMLAFDYEWFLYALERIFDGEQLTPEAFFQSEMMVEFLESMYMANVLALEEMGIPYEMIPELLGMDLMDLIVSQLLSHYGMFGIFSDVAFRPYTQNVILTIPGQSEQKIVMTAHFDSVMVPGASDNASGVALLLESAYRMLDVDNYYTLVYVFAGAEEVGLVGIYYYVSSLTAAERDNVVLNINADVLFEGPYFIVGTAQSGFAAITEDSEVAEIASTLGLLMAGYGLVENDLSRAVNAVVADVNATYGTQLIEWIYAAAMPSDQLMFLLTGQTVVSFAGLARAGDPAYNIIGGVTPMFEIDGVAFGASVVHSPFDDIHFINEMWPDKVADAMWTFSLILDALLNMSFTNR